MYGTLFAAVCRVKRPKHHNPPVSTGNEHSPDSIPEATTASTGGAAPKAVSATDADGVRAGDDASPVHGVDEVSAPKAVFNAGAEALQARFMLGFAGLFLLAGVMDVLYTGEQLGIVLTARVVLAGLAFALHLLLRRAAPLPFLPVHAALLFTVFHAFTVQLLVPDVSASVYWGMAAFAVMAAPLGVNWSQTHALFHWLTALGVVLLTIYTVPALDLGLFLLDGGGFYLAALTFAIVLPAGWIPLQERLARRRGTPRQDSVPGRTPDTMDDDDEEAGSSSRKPEEGRHSMQDDVFSEKTAASAESGIPGVDAASTESGVPGASAAPVGGFTTSTGSSSVPEVPSGSRKKFNSRAFADLFDQGGGAPPLETEPVHCAGVLTSVLTSAQPIATSRNVNLVFVQPDTAVYVRANIPALHQVFTKIADTLLRNTADSQLQVVLDTVDTYTDVHLAVSRFGLSPDNPEKLFEMLDVLSTRLEPYTASTSTELFTAATLLSRMNGSLLHARTGTDVIYIRVRLPFDHETPHDA